MTMAPQVVELQKYCELTGYCFQFTKLLFQRQFSYCAMVILLYALTLMTLFLYTYI